MASYQIPLPDTFNIAKPEEWPKWIWRFERFRQASGLHTKSPSNQVNALIYCMGDQADDILKSFALTEEEQIAYDTVKGRFEKHFVKHRNVIFKQTKFNVRKQEDGETADSFITDLYTLAEHCECSTLHDQMIWTALS